MLSQLTLSHAATRTANAEGHSARKPVASLAPETLQKRTLAALLHRPVNGSDRPIGVALSQPYVALAALSRRGAEAAREAMTSSNWPAGAGAASRTIAVQSLRTG
jgi:hypothetical protein